MDQENYEKIEQYLGNQLSPEEKIAFEAEMEQNEPLKQAVEEHRISHEAIEVIIEDNLRASFAKWNKKEEVESTSTVVPLKKNRSLAFAIAATLLFLIVFGWIKWGSSATTNQQLLADHFQAFIPSDLRSPVAITGMNEGLTAFEKQDYNAAIDFFLSIPDTSIQYAAAQYSLAHSYYASKDYDSASQSFKNSIAFGDVRYKEKAEWYLLLVSLAQDKTDEAFSTLLDAIADDAGHSYYKSAQDIRGKLGLD